METAEFVRDDVNLEEDIKPMEIVEQPEWVETMDDNVKHYKRDKRFFLKNVVYKDVDGTIVIAVIRGDLSVNKAKLAKVYGAKGELEDATDEDLMWQKKEFFRIYPSLKKRLIPIYEDPMKNAYQIIGNSTMLIPAGADRKRLHPDVVKSLPGYEEVKKLGKADVRAIIGHVRDNTEEDSDSTVSCLS